MIDRLIIEGKEADLKSDERIKLTRQVNDLREVENKKTDFTNQFTLPYTPANNIIFEHVRLYSSDSDVPYKYLDCQLLLRGYPVTVDGKIVLDKTDKRGYRVTIYSGLFNLFEELGRKPVSDLNLTSLNHNQTHTEIVNRNNDINSEVFYPIYSDGYPLTEDIDIKRLVPFVKSDVLLTSLVEQFGFSVSGNFFTDEIIQTSGIYMNGGLSTFYLNNPNPLSLGSDISQADLFKLLLETNNSFISSIDYIKLELEVTKLDTIIENDYYYWSDKVDNLQLPLIKYETSKVGQVNYFSYNHEDNETTGDNSINLTNSRLDPQKDIIDSDFNSIERIDAIINSSSQDLDEIFFFEDADQVKENIDNSETNIRNSFNTEDIFFTSYKRITQDLNYNYQPYGSLRDVNGYTDEVSGRRNINMRYINGFFYVAFEETEDTLFYDIIKLRFDGNSFTEVNRILYQDLAQAAPPKTPYVMYFDFIDENTLIHTGFDATNTENYFIYDVSGWSDNEGENFVPTLLNKTGLNNANCLQIRANNNKIYVNEDDSRIGVYDVSVDPLNPSFLYNINLALNDDILVDGDNLYLSNLFNTNITSYDISNPAAPLLISSYPIETSFNFINSERSIGFYEGSIYYYSNLGNDNYNTAFVDFSSGNLALSTTLSSSPITDFTKVHWSELNEKYYQIWTEIFDEYKEMEMYFNLTLEDVVDFDFKRPVYIESELGSNLFYMNKISNYIEGKPTKCTLIKL